MEKSQMREDGEVTDEFQVSLLAAGEFIVKGNKREEHILIGSIIN